MNIGKTKALLQAREDQLSEKNRELWEKAAADAQRIIKMIRDNYHPVRIWQWGSVLNGDGFQKGSDIDIAVEGIHDPAVFFQLLGDAMEQTPFPLDIVQLDHIAAEFAELIRMKGVLVYENRP